MQIIPNFRIRTVPVLGTTPAIFGMTAASWVLCNLAQKPYIPDPVFNVKVFILRIHKLPYIQCNFSWSDLEELFCWTTRRFCKIKSHSSMAHLLKFKVAKAADTVQLTVTTNITHQPGRGKHQFWFWRMWQEDIFIISIPFQQPINAIDFCIRSRMTQCP